MTLTRKQDIDRFFLRSLSKPTRINQDSARDFLEALRERKSPSACFALIANSSHGMDSLKMALEVSGSEALIFPLIKYIRTDHHGNPRPRSEVQPFIDLILSCSRLCGALAHASKSGSLRKEDQKLFLWLVSDAVTGGDGHSGSNEGKDSRRGPSGQAARKVGSSVSLSQPRKPISVSQKLERPSPSKPNQNDFRRLPNYPSRSELRSEVPPRIRMADDVFDSRFDVEDIADAHIENQYQLYREDFISSIREEFDKVLRPNKGFRPSTPTLRQLARDIDGYPLRSSPYSLFMQFACSQGLWFLTSKGFPLALAHLRTNLNIVPDRALGVFHCGGEMIGFALVERRVADLARNPPVVSVKLVDSNSYREVDQAFEAKRPLCFSMIDAAYFAYIPILEALQKLRSTDLYQQLLRPSQPILKSKAGIPETLKAYSKSLIGTTGDKDGLYAFPLVNTRIDIRQKAAMLSALTRPITAIQGPPGCGKSFIGSAIGKAFFEHTQYRILVVSYTNHALDQFCNDLIEVGIPDTLITRLGSEEKTDPALKKLLLKKRREAAMRHVDELWVPGQKKKRAKASPAAVISNQRIIGCTTTGAAIFATLLAQWAPSVVLIEEAGEIIECHCLTTLFESVKHLVMIGDHKQLRGRVANHNLSVASGSGYDLNRSLMERYILHGGSHITLRIQHRMSYEISTFARQLTYPELIDGQGTIDRPHVLGLQHRVVFVNHAYPEIGDKAPNSRDMTISSSTKNTFEANMAIACVGYLLQQGYKLDDMVVITPYTAQVREIQQLAVQRGYPLEISDRDIELAFHAGLVLTTKTTAKAPVSVEEQSASDDDTSSTSASERADPVMTSPTHFPKLTTTTQRISTVDNYQGEESKIVIASLVRSNPQGKIGFMFEPERLNVLITRARDGMILIGNKNTFAASNAGRHAWAPFLAMLQENAQIHRGLPVVCQKHPDQRWLLSRPQDFESACPDGGCLKPCHAVVGPGKLCQRMCHPDARHSLVASLDSGGTFGLESLHV